MFVAPPWARTVVDRASLRRRTRKPMDSGSPGRGAPPQPGLEDRRAMMWYSWSAAHRSAWRRR